MSSRRSLVLAADVGATTTRLGVYSQASGPRSPLASSTVPTAAFPSLGAIVADFLAEAALEVDAAVFAVAGPVRDGRVQTPSLPWPIEHSELRANLDVDTVLLMNDLEATARSVPLLEPADLVTLREGRGRPGGAIAVVGLGTGLGEAFLIHTQSGYETCPSEGGHASFAPTSETELDLLRALWKRFGYVSYETVCSGAALPDLYAFARSGGDELEPAWLSERLAAMVDQTPVIVEAALSRREGTQYCVAAVELLVSILGAEAGNLALKVTATGGLYLGGGMPSRILPLLRSSRFLARFGDKGRDSEFLDEIPVHVISNTFAGLIGAAVTGLEAIAPHGAHSESRGDGRARSAQVPLEAAVTASDGSARERHGIPDQEASLR